MYALAVLLWHMGLDGPESVNKIYLLALMFIAMLVLHLIAQNGIILSFYIDIIKLIRGQNFVHTITLMKLLTIVAHLLINLHTIIQEIIDVHPVEQIEFRFWSWLVTLMMQTTF